MISKLYDACCAFEKLAGYNIQPALFNSCKIGILNELSAGIQTLSQLMRSDKDAASSEAFQRVDEIFGRMIPYAQGLTIENAPTNLSSLKELIGQALFYTSSSNAGVGYDPLTSKGGQTSIGAVVGRIFGLVQKLLAGIQVQK